MKYSKEQRLDIGRQLYTGKLAKADAVEKYGISYASAKVSA